MRLLMVLLLVLVMPVPGYADPPDEIPSGSDDVWYLPGIVFVGNSDWTSFRLKWMQDQFDRTVFADRDRYNRLAVWPLDKKGRSLQMALVAQGRVYYDGLPGPQRSYFMKAERQARRYRRGLWGRSGLPLDGNALHDQRWQRHLGRFVVVDGIVMATGKGEQNRYLNFGPDWKSDFSVTLPRTRQDLEYLIGRRVSVRGWLEKRNGPSVDLLSVDWLIEADQ